MKSSPRQGPKEEAELIEKDGDPIEAPTSPYKIEPERQGRAVFFFVQGFHFGSEWEGGRYNNHLVKG